MRFQGLAITLLSVLVSMHGLAAMTDGGNPPDNGICRTLEPDLSETMTGHLNGICRVLANQQIPGLPDDVHLGLVAETMTWNLFRGHLEWTIGGETNRGPTLDVGFLDAPLSEAFYQFIVSSLVNASDIPRSDSSDQ